MKLELKHLAPYLPYGLKTKYQLSGVIGLITPQKDEVRDKELTKESITFVLKYCKPILRPLSDLKEGDFGEYLIEEFYTLDFEKQILRILEDNRWVNQCDYLLIQLLIENHYDVFGLIDKGLAIDINTIKS
tara:strand:+ start:2193 stop:2585 length:393 start_codon:yes stop_codon:yes gene_type:complete